MGYLGDYIAMTPEQLSELLHLNMFALSELTQHYAKYFVAEKKGKILQVCSIAAFQPGPQMAAYYATKAYVSSLSLALAYELKKTGVSLSILYPGPTDTNFLKRSHADESLFAKGYLGMMSPKKVAKIAYEDFTKNKLYIIPGFFNKLLTYATCLAPTLLSKRLCAFAHRKMI